MAAEGAVSGVDRIRAAELMARGGAWLGAARKWIQWHRRNGDRVTWGSADVLDPAMTVANVEDIAAEIAEAAIHEDRERVAAWARAQAKQSLALLEKCAVDDAIKTVHAAQSLAYFNIAEAIERGDHFRSGR